MGGPANNWGVKIGRIIWSLGCRAWYQKTCLDVIRLPVMDGCGVR